MSINHPDLAAREVRAFLRACVAAGWLAYRQLRYQPIALILAAAQQWTVVGVWFFVARFLSVGANQDVLTYGGNYVAYVVVGVLLNQVSLAALDGPFQTISDAFWDKRLETYRLARYGIWANIIGRLGWNVLFATLMQGLALCAVLAFGGIQMHAGINLILVVVTYVLLIAANAGVGLAGASLFFLLEVKAGQDPITWAYRFLVQLVSGLYVPITLLPGWLGDVGRLIPQTYGLAAMRSLLLTGVGWSAPALGGSLLGLFVATMITLSVGSAMLVVALREAERRGGIGVVV